MSVAGATGMRCSPITTPDEIMEKLLALMAEMRDAPGWSIGVTGPGWRYISFIAGRPGSIASSPGQKGT